MPSSMSDWDRLLGFRWDIDLDQRWWHRLAKVAYSLVAFLAGSLLLFLGWESIENRPAAYEDIDIKTSLDTFLNKTDESVANVIPAFLLTTGRLGVRNNPERKVESTSEYDLQKSWCTPNAFRHLAATADFLNERDFTSANTPTSVLASIEKVRTPLSDVRNARYCWMHSSLQGTDISSIVKYEFTTAGYFKAAITYLSPFVFWFFVGNVVVLNLYYRGIVYIICGPRQSSVSISKAVHGSMETNKEATVAQLLERANAGDVDAQWSLAKAYYHGERIPQNDGQALRWCREAAEQGHAEAQWSLAKAYQHGEGVPQDHVQALQWYLKAAEQGHADGQCRLGYFYLEGQGVVQNYSQAVEWYRKAAEQGHAGGQYCLGVMYKEAKGVAQDYVQAAHWLGKAAQQGFDFAQFELGQLYAKGLGVPQDDVQAVKWWSKAAEQCNEFAEVLLGMAYRDGRGVPQDFLQAAELFHKGAERGDTLAQFNLHLLYDRGLGVPQDYVEAYKWLNLHNELKAELPERFSELSTAVSDSSLLEALAKKMTSDQLAESQKRAQEWMEAFQRRKQL
jgi:TPR repeat protein